MSRALLLTYHAIEAGPPPLCIDPKLFARHVEVIRDSGATALTVGEFADALRSGTLPERAVVLTFDDGYTSAVEAAAASGLVGTIFCVARRLGGWSGWPSQQPSGPRLPLADAGQLGELAGAGWEVGSHGLDHDVLADGSEFAESRTSLEEAIGVNVRSFAFPYGVVPPNAAPALQAAGYVAACTTRLALADAASEPLALPRVDAHYLRRPALLRGVLAGRFELYLRARAGGARIRRVARKDYVTA